MPESSAFSVSSFASLSSSLPYIGAGIIILYLLLVFWVAKDIAGRTTSWMLQILSIAIAVFLPFIGVLVYVLIRPELLVYKELKIFLAERK